MFELIKSNHNFDFMGKLRYAMMMSVVLVGGGIVLLFYPGIRWGLDFAGGTEVQVRFNKPTELKDIRAALAEVELPDDSVQAYGDPQNHEFLIRLRSTNFGNADDFKAAEATLKEKFGDKVTNIRMVDNNTRLSARRDPSLSPDEIRTALSRIGSMEVSEDQVDANIFHVNFADPSQRLTALLGKALDPSSFEVVRVESVGPKVGAELRDQGAASVLFTTILILIYMAFRFKLEYAPGAILCLLHDVFVTLGVLVLAGTEFNTATVAAMLTVVGYSLNDTVVVFDRIRENETRYRNMEFRDVINKSINETLSRTILTSGTTLVVVIALFFFGGSTLHDFALALMVGIITGTYSSVYVASPVVIVGRKWFPSSGDGAEGAPAAAR